MSELDNSALFDGPFIILRKGMELDTRCIRPQTAPEASCLYCASIITGDRCQSCGAPRRSEKDTRTPWEKWKAWEHGKAGTTSIVSP